VAVCLWGAAIVGFGLVHRLWPALVLLALAGWADVISAVLRSTILQSAVPDAMRARISAIQVAVVEGGPRLGDLEAGAVATAVSPGFSVVSGGLACIAGAIVLTAALPGFRRYLRPSSRAPEPPGGAGHPSPPATRGPAVPRDAGAADDTGAARDTGTADNAVGTRDAAAARRRLNEPD
jgi:hypothetical protein